MTCEHCTKMLEEGNRAEGHAFLQKIGSGKPFKSMFGNIPETDYVCTVCKKEWTYEGGNYGYGWIG